MPTSISIRPRSGPGSRWRASRRSTFAAKRATDSQGRERVVSRSDLNFAVDIINTALARPDIDTFLLFTGDKDFIRLVTTLRNRLGRRVVICGIPGSISPDLVTAAGEEDQIILEPCIDNDIAVIRAIHTYIGQLHEGFVPTQSHMSRTLWRFLDKSAAALGAHRGQDHGVRRKGILAKRQTVNGQNQELVTTELNWTNTLVLEALTDWAPEPVNGQCDDLDQTADD